MQVFPNLTSRFADAYGTLLKPWVQYLQQFTTAPPGISQSTLGPSPFSYVAAEPGQLIVNNGTVSKIEIIRGNVSLDVTGTKIVPVSVADTVKITFSAVPMVNFLPSYGANTNG